ncbi:DNA polymerase III subunit gamma/tau [Acidipila sp. EB88]|uniref:DNA polymerase III subunit gamma/tau n=1 Tax=Acidipila sp. EB88 TaxID=2305226 RepID=UPI000F5EC051|nr:DNA polymerase III subunit gamma/tau [Acidipila sp. EB88]RRA49404.1 DNA polymerase III subunit gamma/tau [Acidipila sp. EB88]
MAYQVLARKYRPQRFSDVVGQDHVTRTLGHALEQNRIAHGYIFSGHRGIGKTTIARILAMALNCRRTIGSPERPTYEPCATCESCEEVRAGNAVDVIEIDAATNRGIDEIRELRDAARYRPARDRYKIYILDEAHQITDAAFNALLKTLEEPPEHVVFMMATTQPEDILQTIRSRCQHFSFHAVKFDAILEQLRTIAGDEHVLVDDEALGLLAEAGDGSMRDALSIMDQAIASAPLEDGHARLDAAEIRELMGTMPNAVFARLLESVGENNSAAVLGELDRLLANGNSPSQIARQLVRYLRNVLMARIGGESTELLQLSPDERARAAGSALLFGEEELTRFLQIMLRTFDELNYRQEQRFHLELGVLKLVHLQRLLPIEELMSQLASSPAGTPGSLPGTSRPATALPPASAPARPPAARPTPAPAAPPGRPAQTATPARTSAAPVVTEPGPEPAFSPFERDAQRKTAPPLARMQTATVAPAAVLPPPSFAIPELPEQAPLPARTASTPLPPAPRPQPPAEFSTPEPDTVPAPPVSPDESIASAPATSAAPSAPSAPTPSAIPASAPSVASDSAPFAATASAPIQAPAPAAIYQPAPTAEPQAVAPPHPAPAAPATQAPPEPPATQAPPTHPAGTLDLDGMREAATSALEGAGHTTAAVLLGNGNWVETPEMVRIEVSAKKTMLGLTMNPEAEKVVRAAIRPFTGQPPRPVQWFPGEGGGTRSTAAAARPAATGSVQALAMENPLVQQAKKLFQAEVRSVVDLRGKR